MATYAGVGEFFLLRHSTLTRFGEIPSPIAGIFPRLKSDMRVPNTAFQNVRKWWRACSTSSVFTRSTRRPFRPVAPEIIDVFHWICFFPKYGFGDGEGNSFSIFFCQIESNFFRLEMSRGFQNVSWICASFPERERRWLHPFTVHCSHLNAKN